MNDTCHEKPTPRPRPSEKPPSTLSQPTVPTTARASWGSTATLVLLLVTVSATPALAQGFGAKLHLHGYLTQGYGQSDGLSLFGLDDNGTSDYRNIALNFRAEISERDDMVVQLVHQQAGNSPFDDLHDDVELDWAYFEHRFDVGTKVRVGRLPIPFGIYNELRDAGTVLEFFRPPVAIYFEGAFSSETVDGLAVGHTFALSDSWGLEANGYYGEWDRAEYSAGLERAAEGTARDGHGLQLWLTTPVSGLRFGLAAQRFDQVGGLTALRSGESDRFTTYLFSIDGDFSRFVVRAELQRLETQFLGIPDATFPAFYVLAGIHATDRLSFYAMREDARSELSFGSAFPTFESTFHKEWALSAVYAFNPQAVLRLEAHRAETILTTEPAPFGGFNEVDYWIASFSASF